MVLRLNSRVKSGPGNIPLLREGGVDATPRKISRNHPVCTKLMWLRDIFLIAQPPLLVQGGEYRFLAKFMPDAEVY
jgi:hypothetical protein